MSNSLTLKLTLSANSTEEQRQEIESELWRLFSKYKKPQSISCKEGSTEIIIQYILDYTAQGFLGAIGAGILAFTYSIIKQKNAEHKAKSGELANVPTNEQEESKIKEILCFLNPITNSQQNIEEMPIPFLENPLCLSKTMNIEYTFASDKQTITKGFLIQEKNEGGNRTILIRKFEDIINKE